MKVRRFLYTLAYKILSIPPGGLGKEARGLWLGIVDDLIFKFQFDLFSLDNLARYLESYVSISKDHRGYDLLKNALEEEAAYFGLTVDDLIKKEAG